jgi:TetR/AcrR family transcriptional regulator, regulator of biofilm formation and stress response
MTETVDRRLERGARRRAELIEATLTVVKRRGVAGVSHRTVAKVAGVSPSAALHHFATLDDLLVAALISGSESSIEGVAEVHDVGGLADVLTDQIVEGRSRFVAVYELYLLAARRRALRAEANRWMASVKDAARRLGADEMTARALCAALDGLGLQALLSDEVPDRTATAETLGRILSTSSRTDPTP